MTGTPSGNENRHEAAPYADLIRQWEAMTGKQPLENLEADLFYNVLVEGLKKLRVYVDSPESLYLAKSHYFSLYL